MKEYRQHRFEKPVGAVDVILVRHGESRAARPEEPFPLVAGQGDPELSALGTQQAKLVGERLRNEAIDAVYVTNLRRTSETAAPLLGHLGLEPIKEPDLREVHLGEWEGGVFRKKVHENDPLYQRMQTEQRWDVIPGAESRENLTVRVGRALDRIAQHHANQVVVAVVHGGIIGHILAHASGAEPFAFNGCDNGSISHVVLTEGKIVVRGFNDRSHLVSLGDVGVAVPT